MTRTNVAKKPDTGMLRREAMDMVLKMTDKQIKEVIEQLSKGIEGIESIVSIRERVS